MDSKIDRCIVSGTNIEYFDCCNRDGILSNNSEQICNIIGGLNLFILGLITIGTVLVLAVKKFRDFKKWYHKGQNKILSFVGFFHILTICWRVLLYLHYAHPDRGFQAKWYLAWKSSPVGDLGNTLSAVCVYLQYFRHRYYSLKSNEKLSFEERKQIWIQQRKSAVCPWINTLSYFGCMWLAIFSYSTFWGLIYYQAVDEMSLAYLDEVMTGVLGCFGFVLTYLSIQLYKQIQHVMQDDFKSIKDTLQSYLISLVASTFFQALMVPLSSSGHTPIAEKIGVDGWDGILEAQCIADLWTSVVIFSLAQVMFTVDQAAIAHIRDQVHEGDTADRLMESPLRPSTPGHDFESEANSKHDISI